MMNWNNFFSATASAASALTGLVFVGISISLTKILSASTLPSRALLSLILLMTIVIFSLLFLVPEQTQTALAIDVTIIGTIVWAFVTWLDVSIFRNKETEFKKIYLLHIFINQLAVVPYIICGITLFVVGDKGIHWIVPAILISFIKAVVDAWVLLIEIHR